MSGPLPSGFSSVDLDRWRSQSAGRAPLSEIERLAIDAASGAVDADSSGGPPEHEVLGVYGGLVDLIAAHVQATHELRRTTDRLVGLPDVPVPPVPFVLGVAGSVAVGKSTVARVLQTLMARWPSAPKVQIVSTDCFLLPNAVLDPAGLTMQKGFPVSYDTRALVEFLIAVRSGAAEVSVPVYSHVIYDVIPGAEQIVQRPDVIILEGVNVLQSTAAPLSDPADLPDPTELPETSGAGLVSDHVDLSIYVDADETAIERWFVDRFAALRLQDHPDERAFYRQFAALSDQESDLVAHWTWSEINRVNLREHIAPTRARAQIVIDKAPDHHVRRVFVRNT